MRNLDDALLRAGKPDPASPQALAHQLLRIALFGEYAARAFHQRMNMAYASRAPFPALARRADARISRLTRLCARQGVACPADPFAQETTLAPGWRQNLERALRGEATTLQRLARLARAAGKRGLADEFATLHTETLKRQIPLLQQALQDALERERAHQAAGVPAADAHMQHGFVGDFMEKAFSVVAGQHGALGVVAPLLRAQPALLGGIAVGSLGLWLARQRIHKQGKDS